MTTHQAISYYKERKITAQSLIEEERQYWQGRAAKGEASPFIISKINYILGTMHSLLEIANALEQAVTAMQQNSDFVMQQYWSAANGEALYLEMLLSKFHQEEYDGDGAPAQGKLF